MTGSEVALLLLHSTYFFCTGDRFRGSIVNPPLNVFLLHRWQVQREQCYFSTQRISSAQVTGSEEAVLLLHSTYFFCTGDRFRGIIVTSPLNVFLLHRWQVQREQCYFSLNVFLLHRWQVQRKQCYFSIQRIFFCTGDRFRGIIVTSPLNVFLLYRWQVQREHCYFSTQRISSAQVTGSEVALLLLHSTYFFCTGDRFRGSIVNPPLNVFLLHRWQVQRKQCYFSTQRISSAQVTGSEGLLLLLHSTYFSAQVTGSEGAVLLLHSTYFFCTGDRFRGSIVTSPLNVFLLHRWQVQREQCYHNSMSLVWSTESYTTILNTWCSLLTRPPSLYKRTC